MTGRGGRGEAQPRDTGVQGGQKVTRVFGARLEECSIVLGRMGRRQDVLLARGCREMMESMV